MVSNRIVRASNSYLGTYIERALCHDLTYLTLETLRLTGMV